MALIGSYGWATQVEKTMESLTGNIKAERLGSVLVNGLPTQDDLARLDALAAELGSRINSLPDLID
jgi:flavorubredoxin